MARYDVDSATTFPYGPVAIEWLEPDPAETADGGWVQSVYWYCRLHFEGDPLLPAAAWETWEAFHDGALHTIELPPPDDVQGADVVYSSVFIKVDERPRYEVVGVTDFTVLIGPIEIT